MHNQKPSRPRDFLAFGLFLVLMGSCSMSAKPKPDPMEAKPDAEQQKKLDEARAELEIGRNMAGRLLKFYGAYPDEKLVRYVNEVGNFVARYSEFPERRYMFEVYNSETVNAFACPGGYILISLGAIKNASNEAELAHVLGHEVAHVGHKHMYNALNKMSQDELEKNATAGAKASEIPEAVKARMRPEPEESELGSTVAKYLSGSTAGLNLLQAAKAGMSVIMEKGLGAELEFAADREGTRYAIGAGYYPKALINFLCRMEVSRGKPKDYCLKDAVAKGEPTSILDKTHPAVPLRVSNVKAVLVSMKADEIIGAKGKKRFMVMKERTLKPTAKKAQVDTETEGKE
ncbi:MAG TPA: M48 family metalloprotease [Oligoflexus sp.]|uniref:M48 family metalloprotease n=1 Tax=Oligoflexus sp. TaxID=1971216 RepID=UPI002D65C1A8|nr:M48 family metalloprotease [Oligoflexus sp.]HYX33815.1 M48 family metalloprotease [Oligoflexus sp.]